MWKRQRIPRPAVADLYRPHDWREFVKQLPRGVGEEEAVQRFQQEVVNNETYFFRDPNLLWAFSDLILPTIEGDVRIASVGCGSGEEVYSMLLESWNGRGRLRIDGYDVNPTLLSAAREGAYVVSPEEWVRFTERDLDRSPSVLTHTPVSPPGTEIVRVSDAAKSSVRLDEHNILQGRLPDVYDMVFMRNVVHHLSDAGGELAIEHCGQSLVPGGHLMFESVSLRREDDGVRCPVYELMRDRPFELVPVSSPPVVDHIPQIYRKL